MAQVVELLCSKYGALNLNHSQGKKKRNSQYIWMLFFKSLISITLLTTVFLQKNKECILSFHFKNFQRHNKIQLMVKYKH
jgi:hypothetical protein